VSTARVATATQIRLQSVAPRNFTDFKHFFHVRLSSKMWNEVISKAFTAT